MKFGEDCGLNAGSSKASNAGSSKASNAGSSEASYSGRSARSSPSSKAAGWPWTTPNEHASTASRRSSASARGSAWPSERPPQRRRSPGSGRQHGLASALGSLRNATRGFACPLPRRRVIIRRRDAPVPAAGEPMNDEDSRRAFPPSPVRARFSRPAETASVWSRTRSHRRRTLTHRHEPRKARRSARPKT